MLTDAERRTVEKEREALVPSYKPTAGIYIHIPFCVSRCAYCTFVTERYRPDREESFVQAVLKEIELRKQLFTDADPCESTTFDTLYFGGGTPSLLAPERISTIIQACMNTYHLPPHAEITLEMNPASVRRKALERLKDAGVNRISLGVQSLNEIELARMRRPHGPRDALTALDDLRAVGFDNISVDVLIGFPGQTSFSLAKTVDTVLQYNPEHVSGYLLELKEDSPLLAEIKEGRIDEPNDDLAADLYEQLCRHLTSAGLEQYEISNFARPGRRAQHNLKYWQDGTWVGIGPGAHGFTGRVRYSNVQKISSYERLLEKDKLPESERISLTSQERFVDALIMGLRLTEGVNIEELGTRYQLDARAFVFDTIGDLTLANLVVANDDRISLTPRGRLLSNVVFRRWV